MIETDFQRREFADGEELAQGLAEWTAERLRSGIAARGVALLVVSGGKSPARFFELLSDARTRLDSGCGHSCRRTARGGRQPTFERAIGAGETAAQPRGGGKLHAARRRPPARGPGTRRGKRARRPSALAGGRRHTRHGRRRAHLPRGSQAPSVSPMRWTRRARQLVAPIEAADAGEPRLTLTGRVILRASAIALEIEGEAKLATFAKALENGPEDAMPIRAVFRRAADRLTVFSAKRA